MAENYLRGNNFLFWIDTVTPTTTVLTDVNIDNTELVACLTDNGFDGTTNVIESASKCAGLWGESIADTSSWTMNVSGEAIAEDGLASRANHNALFKLWRSKTPFWGFMYDIEMETMRYGIVRIDSYSDTAGQGAIQGFSATLTGLGQPGDQDDIAEPTT